MQPAADATVFIVDDDAGVREALAWLLRSRRLLSQSFDSAEAFAAMLQRGFALAQPCCLLLDVRMPGMSGLALFDRLVARGLVDVMPTIASLVGVEAPTGLAGRPLTLVRCPEGIPAECFFMKHSHGYATNFVTYIVK